MAIGVMNWVWDHSRSRHGARLVLLMLADSMRMEGGWAWPSNKEIGRKAGVSERAVQTAIKDLEKLGELEVQYNQGPKGCNRYRVLMTPAESAPPQNLHPADDAPPQDLRDDASLQVNSGDPAESAPPAEPAPPQNSTPTPAESAPGTIREPKSSSYEEDSLFIDSRASKSAKPEKPAKPRRRSAGERIPDDFAITPEMRAWAAEKVPGFDIDTETEVFTDYWRQRADSGALKADWPATWRGWMRRSFKDAGGGSSNGHLRDASQSGRPLRRNTGTGKQINFSDEEYASGWQ